MARPLLPLLTLAGSVGLVAPASFVGCGGSDESRQVQREGDGGEGGAEGGVSNAPGGTSPSGGSGQAGDQASGANPSGGESIGGVAGGTVVGDAGAGSTDPGGAGGTAAAGDGGSAGGGGDPSVCAPTRDSRITLGFDGNNAEWVKNLQWLDSANVLTENVAASGGPLTCGDPSEFFGQAYGAPEGTTPLVIFAGSRASAAPCGLDVTITSTPGNCNAVAQIPWQTEYHFYDGTKASQVRVTRSFGFDETTPKFNGGLRPWQPRVRLAVLPTVIYPNATGTAVTEANASSCGGDCILATGDSWSGQWFADVGPSGLALIVRRDPSMTSAVSLTINWDSYSSSNLTSFVLGQPTDGWKAPVTEVEYLCFADLTSWPQVERDAAALPAWCGP